MKKLIFVTLILVSMWNVNFANNGDSTCTENCKEFTISSLIGEWGYTNFSYQIVDRIHSCEDLIIADNTFLSFQFNEDGTYVKSFGNQDEDNLEVGKWDITEDNQNLVLYPEAGAAAQFIKIGKMGVEKVVLEMDIQEAGLGNLFCDQLNVLNFSKNILPMNESVIK